MGICCGFSIGKRRYFGRPKSRIELTIAESHKQAAFKVLLLGAGESGKTTVMRQLLLLHSKGFTEQDRIDKRKFIFMNLVEGCNALINACVDSGLQLKSEDAKAAANLVVETMEIAKLEHGLNFTSNLLEAIHVLSKDDRFKEMLKDSSQLEIPDGFEYLLNSSHNQGWGNDEWLPNDQEMLHMRQRTAGVDTKRITIDNKMAFEVTDVGGQKSERKNWFRLFKGIEAMIYLQALSDYDRNLFEDSGVNRLEDSLQLWEKTVNHEAFLQSTIIVFLNKRDILEKKFIHDQVQIDPKFGDDVPIFDASKTNDANLLMVEKWFQEKMYSLVHDKSRTVFFHTTTATSSDSMRAVFDAVFVSTFGRIIDSAGL